jgi:hypothetical protein
MKQKVSTKHNINEKDEGDLLDNSFLTSEKKKEVEQTKPID